MSQEIQSIRCKNCEAQIDLSQARDGVVYCPRCRSAFTVAKSADKAAVSQLAIAENLLDGCEFDRAFDAYKKAAEIDGCEPQAFFGMALAEFKVQYLKDAVNDRLQPICHEVTNKRFADNANYKKALSAATAAQRDTYSAKAVEIDRIRDGFYKLKQSGVKYDCFICVKVSSEEAGADGRKIKTRDSDDAHRLHDYLLKHGLSPFFSERDIMDRTGADYEALILYALVCSGCMIVVCSDEEYLKTKWVKNEYTRFIRLINNDEKADDSITIAFRGSPIERLPGRNGKIQGVDLGDPDAFPQLLSFVEAHAQFDAPTISRRTYGEVSVSKKTAIRSGVQKRTLKAYAKSDAPVSEHAKLDIVKSQLSDGEFASAIVRCDAIIAANESCSDAYYYKFLAQNKCRSADEFAALKSTATSFDTLEAVIATAPAGKKLKYYAMLRNKIFKTKDFALYKEFISLPDSDEKDITELTAVLYNDIINCRIDVKYADSALERFDTIIKTVTDTDTFVEMNKGIADWLWHKVGLPGRAERYMAAALDADETDGDCRYDCFVLRRKLTADSNLDKFLLDKSNREDIERELFDYGFNKRAAQAMLRACLRSAETSAELGAELCGYMLSLIPSEQETLFTSFLEQYVYALIKAGKFGLAKSFNEKLLAADKLDHGAYFMSVLINRKYDNPFLLIRDRNTLYDAADYSTAMDAYAERFHSNSNVYMEIVKNLKSLTYDQAQKILAAVDGNVLPRYGAEHFLNALKQIVNEIEKKRGQSFSKLCSELFVRSVIGREKDRQREELRRQKAEIAQKKEQTRRAAAKLIFLILTIAFAAATAAPALLKGIHIPIVYVVGSFLTGMFLIATIFTAKGGYNAIRRGFAAGMWLGIFTATISFAVMLLLHIAGDHVFFKSTSMAVYFVLLIFIIVSSIASLLFFILLLRDGNLGLGALDCANFRRFLFGFFVPIPTLNLIAVFCGDKEFRIGAHDVCVTGIVQIVESVLGVIAAVVFCTFFV